LRQEEKLKAKRLAIEKRKRKEGKATGKSA